MAFYFNQKIYLEAKKKYEIGKNKVKWNKMRIVRTGVLLMHPDEHGKERGMAIAS